MTAKFHSDKVREIAIELTKLAADDTRIVAIGWYGYSTQVIPMGASPMQLQECQLAFYAGAHHVFASIMSFLEPGKEPTGKDMERMTNLAKELDNFVKLVKMKGLIRETNTDSKRDS